MYRLEPIQLANKPRIEPIKSSINRISRYKAGLTLKNTTGLKKLLTEFLMIKIIMKVKIKPKKLPKIP